MFCVLKVNPQHYSVFGVHCCFPKLLGIHLTKTFISLNGRLRKFRKSRFQFFLNIYILYLFALIQLKQRRLGNIYMTLLYKRSHITEEERQKKCSYMLSVNIGICHYNHFSVSYFCNVKIVSYSRTYRGYNREQFFVAENLIYTRFFYVQHFSPKRENCLKTSVTSLLCAAARGISLYNIYLGIFRIP